MSDWVQDIKNMHTKFSVNEHMQRLTNEQMLEFLNFRYRFLQEELTEMKDAIDTKNADLVIDSIIDLIVVAMTTLDAFDIDLDLAWDRVHTANMTKIPGVKASRPNKFGLPDLIKPSDFVSPAHHDNIGLLQKVFNNE